MAKDVNIKVKTEGAEQVQQDIVEIADSMDLMNSAAKKVGMDASKPIEDLDEQLSGISDTADLLGSTMTETGDKVEQALDKPAKKAGILDRVIGGIYSQATRMITGFLGLGAIVKLVDAIIAKFERIQQLQKEITEKTTAVSQVGQALEVATGTTGRQGFWTLQALETQRIGGLGSTEIAQSLMTQMNQAAAAHGGIRNARVMAAMQAIAPAFGAAGAGATDIEKIFASAAEAGITPADPRFISFVMQSLGVSGAQAAAYQASPLAQKRSAEAQSMIRDITASQSFGGFTERMSAAQSEMNRRIATGRDKFWVPDEMEAVQVAFESLQGEIQSAMVSETDPARLAKMGRLSRRLNITDPWQATQPLIQRGGEVESQFRGMSINHINNTNFYPTVSPGSFRRGGRVDPNDI
jgi:uncharacterized protein YoxC